MKVAATRYSRIRLTSAASRFVAFVVVLAFTLQSFIIQTHIHGTSQTFGAAAIVKILTDAPGHGQLPVDNSPVDCPFCQAIDHVGAFFAPAMPLLLLPAAQAERMAHAIAARVMAGHTALNWRSRAPPPR
jgi:hypothetical protein